MERGVILCQRSLHSWMQLICQSSPHRHGTAYFFLILFKQREETRPYCSHISDHTSFLRQHCEGNKKIQELDVYFCFYLKGGTLRAFDTFPEQWCISEKQQALKSRCVSRWFVLTHHSRDSKLGFSSSSKDTLKPRMRSQELHQTQLTHAEVCIWAQKLWQRQICTNLQTLG